MDDVAAGCGVPGIYDNSYFADPEPSQWFHASCGKHEFTAEVPGINSRKLALRADRDTLFGSAGRSAMLPAFSSAPDQSAPCYPPVQLFRSASSSVIVVAIRLRRV